MPQVLFYVLHNLLPVLRLSVGFCNHHHNRRGQLHGEKRRVVLLEQALVHHIFDDFGVHLLNTADLVACGDFGKALASELLTNKEFSDFSDYRVKNGKLHLFHSDCNKFIPAVRQLAEMLLRAEALFITRLCRVDQRVQNILLALKVIVERRRFNAAICSTLVPSKPFSEKSVSVSFSILSLVVIISSKEKD